MKNIYELCPGDTIYFETSNVGYVITLVEHTLNGILLYFPNNDMPGKTDMVSVSSANYKDKIAPLEDEFGMTGYNYISTDYRLFKKYIKDEISELKNISNELSASVKILANDNSDITELDTKWLRLNIVNDRMKRLSDIYEQL